MLTRDELSEREQALLKALVERYIQDGQPVGSKVLSSQAGLKVSSATVRNVMADLEQMGLITSPHTSAGRVPTASGYRLFVDHLLTVQPLNRQEVLKLESSIQVVNDPRTLISSATNVLSSVTHMAGVVMLPRQNLVRLRQVEFLPLSDRRVLVVLVINESDVQNRIIHTDRDYTESELQQTANYLNSQFVGKDLDAIREAILAEMQSARQDIDATLKAAIEMADKAFQKSEQDECLVSGETNLMSYDEMADMGKLRALFEVFHQKSAMLSLLDKSMKADGVQIFIGEESGHDVLGGCSVVTAPYQVNGNTVGVLGVVGPARMAYNRMISTVDVTAKILSAALNSKK